MIDYILHSEDMQGDQWKLYPTQTVPWTVIKKWNESGQYTPYAQDDLIELMIWIKSRVPPWIRLNRVIRDIPEHYISAGNPVSNLRQTLLQRMKKRGLKCKCIRCREIGAFFRDINDNKKENKMAKIQRKRLKRQRKKNKNKNIENMEDIDQRTDEQKEIDRIKEETERKNSEIVMKEREYKSSGGDERFISFERMDEQYIYGFVRLRLPPKYNQNIMEEEHKNEFEEIYAAFPELFGAALVRELHVYGQMIKVGDKKKIIPQKNDLYAQHYGFGTKLMKRAELIALENGYKRIAVIAGIGTRGYYKKLGYELKGTYMVKELKRKYLDFNWMLNRINTQTLLVASGLLLAVGATYFIYHRRGKQKDSKK